MKFARTASLALAMLLVSCLVDSVWGQGCMLPGVGTINRSMGGAAVAAPLDAAGAIQWNPATLSGLPGSQVVASVEILACDTTLSSSDGVNAGSTGSDTGAFVLPTLAIAWKPEDSVLSYGLGVLPIGGFGFNFAQTAGNPVLDPTLGGLGELYSRLSIMQIVPTVSLQVTDRLSVGIAPTITAFDLAIDPNAFSAGYPSATHGRINWGMGFQLGAYYTTDSCWSFGASYKSPQWLEKAKFNATVGGVPTPSSLDLDLPSIISLGTSYAGIPGLLWALDVRYLVYESTQGFGDAAGFGLGGVFTGLGWESVLSVATGVQYQLNDRLTARLGYVYNENPIGSNDTFFNVASPAIYQHIASVGASCQLSESTSISLAYLHAFENSISGTSFAPLGTVTLDQHVNAVVGGLEISF